jgi:hypothetical protein
MVTSEVKLYAKSAERPSCEGWGLAAVVRVAIGKVIQSKRKISGEREDDQPLADNQRHVAYAYELDEDYQNSCVSDAHAGKRQVMRRLGPVNAFYLKKNINVQSYVGKKREQVEKCHMEPLGEQRPSAWRQSRSRRFGLPASSARHRGLLLHISAQAVSASFGI